MRSVPRRLRLASQAAIVPALLAFWGITLLTRNTSPRRPAMDNSAVDNWYDSGRRTGSWTPYVNNRDVNNTLVPKDAWPAEARTVIDRSGIEPEKH